MRALAARHAPLTPVPRAVSEFYAARLLVTDAPTRLLTELAAAWRGRPRDDDVTAALLPYLQALCTAPLPVEQAAQVEELSQQVERAERAERERAQVAALPADEARHLAALRAHLECATAAVASEQALYDALVTLCASLGPPPRLYARPPDTLQAPALRTIHERVLSGSGEAGRLAGYRAVLAFAGGIEPVLQTLYAQEVRTHTRTPAQPHTSLHRSRGLRSVCSKSRVGRRCAGFCCCSSRTSARSCGSCARTSCAC